MSGRRSALFGSAYAGAIATAVGVFLAAGLALGRSGLPTPGRVLVLGPLLLSSAAFAPFLLSRRGRAFVEAHPHVGLGLTGVVWLSPALALLDMKIGRAHV